MQRFALALQQRVVGRVLHQRVLERVHRLRDRAVTESEPRCGQARERVCQRRLAHHVERRDQLVAELAPDDRADLRDLLDRCHAFQPRRQRVAQRLRDRHAGGGARVDVAIAFDLQVPRLDDHLREFLHEERHAIGPGDDLRGELRRQRFAAGELRQKRAALLRCQLGEAQRRHALVLGPARLKLGAVGEHDQQRDAAELGDEQTERIERGGVGPVRVLEQHQTRLRARRRLHDIHQHADRFLLREPRRHGERTVAFLARHRQHGRDEARVLQRQAVMPHDERLDLVQPGCGRLLAAERQRALEVGADRIKSAVDVERRTLKAQGPHPRGLQLLAQRAQDAALADTRLA